MRVIRGLKFFLNKPYNPSVVITNISVIQISDLTGNRQESMNYNTVELVCNPCAFGLRLVGASVLSS